MKKTGGLPSSTGTTRTQGSWTNSYKNYYMTSWDSKLGNWVIFTSSLETSCGSKTSSRLGYVGVYSGVVGNCIRFLDAGVYIAL